MSEKGIEGMGVQALREALADLEICANTVIGCYRRNPGNFAAALRDLDESTERARAALEGSPPVGVSAEPVWPAALEVGLMDAGGDSMWRKGWNACLSACKAAAPPLGQSADVQYWPTCEVCGAGGNCAHREPEVGQSADVRDARLRWALVDLCQYFPTDTDMGEAGWNPAEVAAACDAYDRARAALAEQAGPSFLGMPVVVDPSMPPDTIKFVDSTEAPSSVPQAPAGGDVTSAALGRSEP